MKRACAIQILGLIVVACLALPVNAQSGGIDGVALFRELQNESDNADSPTLKKMSNSWRFAFVPPLVEFLRIVDRPRLENQIVRLLESKTNQHLGQDINAWFEWIWARDIEPLPRYADIKALLYETLDRRFRKYFASVHPTSIKLDEVRWGGVQQNGIPPLKTPKMIKSGKAQYLADSDIVFGIAVNGDVRAYPKRILAWHEMFIDTVGGVHVTGAY